MNILYSYSSLTLLQGFTWLHLKIEQYSLFSTMLFDIVIWLVYIAQEDIYTQFLLKDGSSLDWAAA